MIGIFYDDGDGVPRMTGYAREGYRTTDENESTTETTTDDLSSVFEQAKSNGETLDGVDSTIEDAIDNPLDFSGYLILDTNDAIVFDSGYVRDDETSS